MDYFLLIFEFYVLRSGRGIVNILIPALFGILIYNCSDDSLYLSNSKDFHSNIITIIGILIGFTVSTLAILLTVANKNVEKAKNASYGKKLFSKDWNIYDVIVNGLAYIILIQSLLLIGNFIYPVFIDIQSIAGKLYYSINLSLVTHIIIILTRSILDFYFVITKKD